MAQCSESGRDLKTMVNFKMISTAVRTEWSLYKTSICCPRSQNCVGVQKWYSYLLTPPGPVCRSIPDWINFRNIEF